jgi:hypothetical protein
MSNQPKTGEVEPESKVLGELFREAIGLENGLARTFIDLRKNPRQVLENYKAGDRRYVSPFRLLITSMSLWILINGFLIDWYIVWKDLMSMVLHGEAWLISWIKDYDEAGRAALTETLSKKTWSVMDIYCRFAGDLFSKWYVPYTLVSVVGGSIHYTRRQGMGKLTLRDALYILSYSIGSNIPFFLLLSLLFWAHIGAALVACFAVLALNLLGYSQFLSYAPIQDFIAHDGKAVEKKIMHSVFLVVLIGLGLLSGGYMAYFILL